MFFLWTKIHRSQTSRSVLIHMISEEMLIFVWNLVTTYVLEKFLSARIVGIESNHHYWLRLDLFKVPNNRCLSPMTWTMEKSRSSVILSVTRHHPNHFDYTSLSCSQKYTSRHYPKPGNSLPYLMILFYQYPSDTDLPSSSEYQDSQEMQLCLSSSAFSVYKYAFLSSNRPFEVCDMIHIPLPTIWVTLSLQCKLSILTWQDSLIDFLWMFLLCVSGYMDQWSSITILIVIYLIYFRCRL
jgi:hypothetical protein